MAVNLAPHVPKMAPNDGVIDAAKAVLGDALIEARGAKPKRSRSQRGMEACIISTAQQARPKVIHHSEPVLAQVNRSSAVVTIKPFSFSDC